MKKQMIDEELYIDLDLSYEYLTIDEVIKRLESAKEQGATHLDTAEMETLVIKRREETDEELEERKSRVDRGRKIIENRERAELERLKAIYE